MRFLLFTGFLFFGAALFAQGVFDPGWPRDGIYIKENSRKKYLNIPTIKITFPELKDSVAFGKSKEKINAYKIFKSAPAKFPGMVFINPALQSDSIIERFKKEKTAINALRYYVDTTSFKYDSLKNSVEGKTYLPFEKIFQPFYIGEMEVTNEEWREFVFYVRDSLARTMLANDVSDKYGTRDENDDHLILNWKIPIPWDSESSEIRQALEPLWYPHNERYYKRKELDARKMNLTYFYNWGEKDEHKIYKNVINVYPDTLAWVRDFSAESTFFEKFTNIYYWHPAFKDFPVAGISHMQAQAFMLWKVKKLQAELDKKGIKLRIELDFPTTIEWEMISGAAEKNNLPVYFPPASFSLQFSPENILVSQLINSGEELFYPEQNKRDSAFQKKYSGAFNPKDFKTPVPQINKSSFEKYSRYKEANERLKENQKNLGPFYVYPTTCFPDKVKVKNVGQSRQSALYVSGMVNKKGVSFMNGNVSEWLRERAKPGRKILADGPGYDRVIKYIDEQYSAIFPYQGYLENWQKFYLKALEKCEYDGLIKYKQEITDQYKNYGMDYRMVAGANWYDMGDVINGANKYTFVCEDSAHATVGFRYVIRFEEKK